MIVVLEWGMGNVGSINNMVRKVGENTVVTSDSDIISQANAIILPGVGAIDSVMLKLKKLGLLKILHDKIISQRTPFLGICLGMQVLFKCSEEGKERGLGWIDGEVKRFDFSDNEKNRLLKIPHMGWNLVRPLHYDSLFAGFNNEETRFYFVHSYHAIVSNVEDSLAVANYGYDFCCAVERDNIWGVQFHPEKSHRFGQQLFKNFLRFAGC